MLIYCTAPWLRDVYKRQGKGGSDFDPKGKSDDEIMPVSYTHLPSPAYPEW